MLSQSPLKLRRRLDLPNKNTIENCLQQVYGNYSFPYSFVSPLSKVILALVTPNPAELDRGLGCRFPF